MNIFRHKKRRPRAFTYMEIIVVIIVLGVLAAIAIPNVRIQMLKMENQEAIHLLMVIWAAQKSYYQESGSYAPQYDYSNLDIDPVTPKYFTGPGPDDETVNACYGSTPTHVIGFLISRTTDYYLYATEDGRIVCREMPCANFPLCKQMGFPDW